MNPLILLAVGLGIVLGGILWLRLHPFLALMLGAMAVGGLTSHGNLQRSMAAKYRGELMRAAIQEQANRTAGELQAHGTPFDRHEVRSNAQREIFSRLDEFEEAARVKAEAYVSTNPAIRRITFAMGETFSKVGLLIAMACVVGRCLLASGAAESIVRRALGCVGERGAPVAFSASTFLLSIPVFFDSVFLLVIPLAKATALKLRRNYLLFILAVVTGGTMTHSLVPPTPGPLFVAEELGVNVGTMILAGTSIGLCCTVVGLVCAYWLNRRVTIPVRDTTEALQRLEDLSRKDLDRLPPLWLALTPVVLPVLLISGLTLYTSRLQLTESVPSTLALLGDKNVALSISAVIAMLVAAAYLKERAAFADQMQSAIQEASLIILICCAGGAFGATLQQSGIGPYVSSLSGSKPLDFALLPLAFLLTAVIRGAQGSSTVAMFTAVEIVGSLAPDLHALSYHPVYLAIGIGCGSKPFPWMNDSGFWVISRMSGMTERETLRTHTPMVTIMGVSGILITMLAAKVFPMCP
ncbi:MAG: GntP family permease [Planctomycetales bacterium]|nr:GntP family permease [Planctomycetales bacterium]